LAKWELHNYGFPAFKLRKIPLFGPINQSWLKGINPLNQEKLNTLNWNGRKFLPF